jgi:hypothetical protein
MRIEVCTIFPKISAVEGTWQRELTNEPLVSGYMRRGDSVAYAH